MKRVGINVEHALGVSIPHCRRTARAHRDDHELALSLWASGIHEARIVASMVDDPLRVTEGQMELWVADFDGWDLCDQTCSNLFGRTPHAYAKARAWVRRQEEFVKRAGFTLIAERAVHDHEHGDDAFWIGWLPTIRAGAGDNAAAIAEAEQLLELDALSARWIARDALRELRSEQVQERVRSLA